MSTSVMSNKSSVKTWLMITLPFAILIPTIIFFAVVFATKGKSWNDESKVAFSIGSMEVAWYGIFIFFGFACAIFLSCIKLWKLYKCSIEPFYWFCIFAIPLAIVGANFGSCVLGSAHGGKPWSEFFTHFGSGLAIEWGVAFVIIAAFIYFPLVLRAPKYQIRDTLSEPNKVRQVSIWVYVDAIVPTILIGQILGRWGNYMNQEVYGNVIANGWYHDFVKNWFSYMASGSNVYQPLFFYEQICNFVGLMLIYFVFEFVAIRKCGDLGLLYFLWYGIVRISLNPLRDPLFGPGGPNMVFTIIWIVIAIIMLILNHTIMIKLRTKWISVFISDLYKIRIVYPWTIRAIEKQNKIIGANANSEQVSEAKNKLIHLNDKLHELETIKQNTQINQIRSDDDMLYYLGR